MDNLRRQQQERERGNAPVGTAGSDSGSGGLMTRLRERRYGTDAEPPKDADVEAVTRSLGVPDEAKKGFFERVKNVAREEYGQMAGKAERAADAAGRSQSWFESIFQTGAAAAKGGASIVGRTALEGVKSLTPEFIEKPVAEGIRKAGEAIAPAVAPAVEKAKEIAEAHPRLAANVGAGLDVASAAGTITAGNAVTGLAERAVGKLPSVTDDFGESISKNVVAKDAARMAKAQKEADSVVGKIVQGKTSDIPDAKKALASLDTSEVKTYADLAHVSREKIKTLAAKVDEVLDADTNLYKVDDFAKTATAGAKTATTNPLTNALDNLEELYKNTDDVENLTRVQALKEKAAAEGLRLSEANEVAREYGSEFGSKAFSKLDEPLTSVNAVRYENTRKALKEAVRGKMPNEAARALDGEMSNLFTLERLSKQMAERVNGLSQKIVERNLVEKIARGLGKAFDVATLGGPKAFVTKLFFPSNVGMKTLNSLDLQAMLMKNLKKLDRILDLDDVKAVEALISRMKSGNP